MLIFIDNYEVCGLHGNIFNNGGIEVAYPDDCRALDRRSGLTFFKYLHPANFSQPDLVITFFSDCKILHNSDVPIYLKSFIYLGIHS